MTWTLTKKLDCHLRVQARSRGREVVLDPQDSPEEIKSREVGAGLRKLDLSFASVVPQQQCYGSTLSLLLFSAQQLKQQLRSTLTASQWRGPHCLNIVVMVVVKQQQQQPTNKQERKKEQHHHHQQQTNKREKTHPTHNPNYPVDSLSQLELRFVSDD